MKTSSSQRGKWPRAVALGAAIAALAAAYFAPAAQAAGPSWSLTPSSWDFGTLVPGSGPSAPKAFTLENTGDTSISGLLISVENGEGSGFSLAGKTCTGTLAQGASCQINVTFNPSSPGPKSGKLQVSSLDVPPVSAALSGTGAGPEVSLAPNSLSFGALPLGTVSAPQTFTVTNTGSLDLTISWLAIVLYINGDTDQFSITGGTCAAGSVVSPGGSCTVEARFAPTRAGQRIADLLITSDAPSSPDRVELTGVGVAPEVQPFLLPPFIDPRVTILHGPAKLTSKRKAVFRLRGSATAATIACKIDHEEAFKRCQSPVRYRGLRPGRHRFAVRAFDPQGRAGSVSVYRWTVE